MNERSLTAPGIGVVSTFSTFGLTELAVDGPAMPEDVAGPFVAQRCDQCHAFECSKAQVLQNAARWPLAAQNHRDGFDLCAAKSGSATVCLLPRHARALGGTAAQVSGGATWLAQAQAGRTIGLDQATVQWTANENYSATHAAISGGIITAQRYSLHQHGRRDGDELVQGPM